MMFCYSIEKPVVNKPFPPFFLLPVEMLKVVSVGIPPHCHCHTDPFSSVGRCNSRSVLLNCQRRGEADQPGTSALIYWPHF